MSKDRCAVDGCDNFRAGYETADLCWTHEGNWIEEAAFKRGRRDGLEDAAQYVLDEADGTAEQRLRIADGIRELEDAK